jgi:hypothetical protein
MPSPDKAAEILSRFPGPVGLQPSRVKWIVVLLGSAGFVAIGVFIMPWDSAETWFVTAFFGICMAAAIVILLPGAGGLRLDRQGFQVTSLYRSHFVRWPDATGFKAATVPPARQTMVVFDDAGAAAGALGRLNVGLIGRTSSLPDTYGMSADELAGLMERWRERAVDR